jgi:hypothetical protein
VVKINHNATTEVLFRRCCDDYNLLLLLLLFYLMLSACCTCCVNLTVRTEHEQRHCPCKLYMPHCCSRVSGIRSSEMRGGRAYLFLIGVSIPHVFSSGSTNKGGQHDNHGKTVSSYITHGDVIAKKAVKISRERVTKVVLHIVKSFARKFNTRKIYSRSVLNRIHSRSLRNRERGRRSMFFPVNGH